MVSLCRFGKGTQEASECAMIYLHVSGYYPTQEAYSLALAQLCPNYKWCEGKIVDRARPHENRHILRCDACGKIYEGVSSRSLGEPGCLGHRKDSQ